MQCHKILLIILSLGIVLFAQDKIALTQKARGDVKLKRAKETSFKNILSPGILLYNEDHVKTGDGGYAAIVFLDDKSSLIIRENSEIVIQGKKGKDAISKNISMNFGTLKAKVEPQRKGEFIVATPTSVASVKGTEFWVQSDPVQGDIFWAISGFIEVKNRQSGAVITVGANQTGHSKPTGDVKVEQTKPNTVPVDPEAPKPKENNILRIQLRNPSGETKDIKIEY